MDFKEIAETCTVPVDKLKIKNVGSVVNLGKYYTDLYNALIEKWGLICQESRYVHNEKPPDGVQGIEWDWFAYKKLDNFARVRFNCSALTWYVKGDKVAGKFSVSYTIELDYNKTWRNSGLLKWFLPTYLKMFYQSIIIQWIERYSEELDSIKNKVRELLNISVFE